MAAFDLIPYPAENLPQIKITGDIERTGTQISALYTLRGEINSILLPTPSIPPTRKHDLWKATCFEFFIAPAGQPQYWEFNLAPSGNWNVYHMDDYRQVNMREEEKATSLPFTFQKTNTQINLEISVNTASFLPSTQKLEVGIAAIIQSYDEVETYWALAHPNPQADFHHRNGFTIIL
jgi:hypothetical protein